VGEIVRGVVVGCVVFHGIWRFEVRSALRTKEGALPGGLRQKGRDLPRASEIGSKGREGGEVGRLLVICVARGRRLVGMFGAREGGLWGALERDGEAWKEGSPYRWDCSTIRHALKRGKRVRPGVFLGGDLLGGTCSSSSHMKKSECEFCMFLGWERPTD